MLLYTNKNIGKLIKQRRTKSKMTLKGISEATELFIGYLSRLERGLTSIAHDTLRKVAKTLRVEVTYLMEQPKTKEGAVLRSYERRILRTEGSSIIEYVMTNMVDRGEILSELVGILPQGEVEKSLPCPYEGEEFIYVLGDILTLQIKDDVCSLYPGGRAHYKSTRIYNRSNQTNKVVKFITINTPSLSQEAGEKL